jgi:Uma2 family endonuclease
MDHGSVTTVARRRATYADLCEVPDHLIAEIIDGELVTSPRPAPAHALAASAIGSVLFDRFNDPPGGARPGGWWILYEPELHLGDDVLVPDLAAWRRERMSRLPDEAYFTIAPDWVCEVISPSSGRLDRVRKMPIYAREGVGHLWLVDPLARTLEVYRASESAWAVAGTFSDADVLTVLPFDAASIEMRRWWPDDAS